MHIRCGNTNEPGLIETRRLDYLTVKIVDMSETVDAQGAFAVWLVENKEFLDDLDFRQCWESLEDFFSQRPAWPGKFAGKVKEAYEKGN